MHARLSSNIGYLLNLADLSVISTTARATRGPGYAFQRMTAGLFYLDRTRRRMYVDKAEDAAAKIMPSGHC